MKSLKRISIITVSLKMHNPYRLSAEVIELLLYYHSPLHRHQHSHHHKVFHFSKRKSLLISFQVNQNIRIVKKLSQSAT